MRTRQLAGTLTALANLAEGTSADQLRRFARVFSSGNDETIAARLKKMSQASGHPAALKENLEVIREGFQAAGATKQATAIDAILDIFVGRGDASVEAFIAEITVPRQPVRRTPAPPLAADSRLARELAEQLSRTVLDADSFSEVLKQLRAPKLVNTPTLAIVANRFLGNSKTYSGRKNAIDDIIRRQKSDAREHARGKALNRVGV